jgi:hypothetical protein
MKLKWHKTFTPAKWSEHPIDRQILMVATEFARAKSLIQKNDNQEVKNCYERAFELLDLCTYDQKWLPKLKELLRFREFLGELYLSPNLNLKLNNSLFSVLLLWNPKTALVKI